MLFRSRMEVVTGVDGRAYAAVIEAQPFIVQVRPLHGPQQPRQAPVPCGHVDLSAASGEQRLVLPAAAK